MFCTQCGASNPDGSKFCMRCGARLEAPTADAQAAPAQPTLPQEQPPRWPAYQPEETAPWTPTAQQETAPWSPEPQAERAAPPAPYPDLEPLRPGVARKRGRPWLWAAIGFVAVLLIAFVASAFFWEGNPLRSLFGGGGPEHIAYIDEDGNVAIVLPDGSEENVLTDDGGEMGYRLLSWSPDHRWLAAYREDWDREEYKVWISSADGEEVQTIEVDMKPECEQPAGCMVWSPDGSKLALVGYDIDYEMSLVLVVDVKKQGADTVVEDDEKWFASVAWLPDGDRIALTVVDDVEDEAYIELMRADGSDPERMVLDEEDDITGLPLFAPKGGRMAYVTYNISSDRIRLYVAKSDGSDAERISRSEYDLVPLDWSDNGSRLLYYNDDDEELLVYDVRSGDEIKVADSEGDLEPFDFAAALSPDGMSVAYYNQDYDLIVFDLETEGGDRLVQHVGYSVDW